MSEAFEGTSVVDFQAKLPAVTVDCDYYPHGTVLRLAVEVRVKGVGHDEDKEGNFVRIHKLGIQDIEVVSSYNPADANDQVGGSLAGGAPLPDDEGLGIETKVTSDQWPSGVGKRVDPETGEILPEPTEGPVPEVEPEPEPVREAVEVGF